MSTPEDDDLLAAEYVLGVLDLEARAAAEARLREPGFAAAVQAWEGRLSGLNGEFAEALAPDLMPRIEARLFPQAPRRRGFWAWGAALAGAAAVVLWIALTPLQPDFTATLLAQGSTLEYDATLTAGRLTVARKAGSGADPAHAHELWLIVGDAAPVSLGLLGQTTTVALHLAPEGAVLAVSLEPAGGSPTGQPTGPVIAMGKLEKA